MWWLILVAYFVVAGLSWRPFALALVEHARRTCPTLWRDREERRQFRRHAAIGAMGACVFWPCGWGILLVSWLASRAGDSDLLLTRDERDEELRARQVTELHELRRLAREHGLPLPEEFGR